MRESDLQYLVCPQCRGDLIISSVAARQGEEIETARLSCPACGIDYPVVRHIPRLVPIENYASSFGLEWKLHAKTQYDSYTGLKLSEKRFFEETCWERDLRSQMVLEVGSGSGRFTEQAASTGAFVVSMDYSNAVEVNYQFNGHKPDVFIVQADVYQMPFRPGSFDKLFCFGVLQHTPDVRGAFFALPPMLKPGGRMAIDVYKKTFLLTILSTKNYVRWLTRRMDPEPLYRLTRSWVDLMWPICTIIRKIPRFGPTINWLLLVADYSRTGLSGNMLKEWAYLDTFDMLSPRYDSPQTISTVRRWFAEAGLVEVDVQSGYNGIEGRGRKPKDAGCDPGC
jgi:SAM-dependent methyltransferase